MAFSRRTYAALILAVAALVLLAGIGFLALSALRTQRALASLHSGDPAVRDAAVAALAKCKSPYAVDELIALVFGEKEGSTAREAAMSALVGIGGPAVTAVVLSAHPEVAEGGGRGSGRSRDLRLARFEVSQIIKRIGPVASGPLVALLKDESPAIRADAAELLGTLKDPDVADALLALLDDNIVAVRTSAIYALGECGGPAVVAPLIAVLAESRIASCRGRAADALGRIGDPSASEPLVAALGDTDAEVRSAAAVALGRIPRAGAVEPLIACLDDRDVRVRASGAEALGLTGDARAVEPLIISLEEGLRESRRAPPADPGETGGAMFSGRMLSFARKLTQVRADAAIALGRLADPRAVEPLTVRLGDPDVGVRISAAWSLGVLKDARAVEPLIALAGDPDADVRRAAVRALGEIGDPRGVGTAIAALGESDGRVRFAAVSALGQMGDARAVDPLIEHLRDPDADVRSAAAEALGRLRAPRAFEPLLAMLQAEDVGAQMLAVVALWGYDGPRVIEAIRPLLQHEDTELRWQAARTLERIGTPEARKAVDEFLGIDLADIARTRRAYIVAGDEPDMWLLILALERHGTAEMAADFFHSESPGLSSYTTWWAGQRGLSDELEASKDSPERPKWGRR